MMRITACSLLILAACDSSVDPTLPPDPPPPWGVPISGGTLLITGDGRRAVASDPDRDRVVTVDLASGSVVSTLALTAGDEPGRIVEDGAGRIHVALRRGGAIVTFDPATAAVVARRPVCAEPRGLAWSPTDDVVHVACTDGQLVSFAAAGGDATRRLQLDRDLRDVLVVGDQLVVTRFRTAELITLDAAGIVVDQTAPVTVQREDFDQNTGEVLMVDADAAVAWRTIALADGRVVMSHQRKIDVALRTQENGGYGVGCHGGPIEDAITVMVPGQPPVAVAPAMFGALPVDIAAAPAGDQIAIAFAGTHEVHLVSTSVLAVTDTEPCPTGRGDTTFVDGLGAPTSVAYTPSGDLVVLYPEAPALVVHQPFLGPTRMIALPGGVGYDAGRELFHTPTALGIACASCHPEARDDGQVWNFASFGTRRTQSLAGNILGRAPYHWTGDQASLSALMDEVFVFRMAGGPITDFQRRSLGPWLDRIPAPAPIAGDPAAIARGQVLFESGEVGCVACHNGPLMTNNGMFNVGTNGTFKVPSLRGVNARAPYIHDGCAATLDERLTAACAGGDLHGHTSQLTAAQRGDLVAYLESL